MIDIYSTKKLIVFVECFSCYIIIVYVVVQLYTSYMLNVFWNNVKIKEVHSFGTNVIKYTYTVIFVVMKSYSGHKLPCHFLKPYLYGI